MVCYGCPRRVRVYSLKAVSWIFRISQSSTIIRTVILVRAVGAVRFIREVSAVRVLELLR